MSRPQLSAGNLVIIYTGNGKGKTTAALGLALRASRERMKVIMVQFIKSEKGSGEVGLKKVLPELEVKCFGQGFISLKHENTLRLRSGQVKTLKQKKEIRKNGCNDINDIIKKGIVFTKQVVKSGKYEVIILDEIFVAYDLKLIQLNDIVGLVKEFREKCQNARVSSVKVPSVKVSECQSVKVLVLTGRGCPKSLYKYADLITEMKEVKHPYKKGMWAVRGIDY